MDEFDVFMDLPNRGLYSKVVDEARFDSLSHIFWLDRLVAFYLTIRFCLLFNSEKCF